MAYVLVKNPNISVEEITNLTAAASDGATTIQVRDTGGYTANEFIVVGNVGSEATECRKISAVTDDHNLALSSALLHDHPNGTVVQRTPWDQYTLQYRAASSGTFADIAGMPKTLEWDNDNTYYNHTTSVSAGQFRFRFYNSQTASYSDYSDTVNSTGYGRDTAAYMIKKIRKTINDINGKVVSDDEIMRYLNDAQDQVSALDTAWYFLLTEDNTTTKTTAGTREYAFPTDFQRLESLRFRYISTTSTSTSTTA